MTESNLYIGYCWHCVYEMDHLTRSTLKAVPLALIVGPVAAVALASDQGLLRAQNFAVVLVLAAVVGKKCYFGAAKVVSGP